ncbi:MAG: prolyl oligopeptidase family serine peptidase [Anaerolineae bacterium]|nr:prolyl oligopeptidase family serine peptidase [Anaerolineae bacterium]
MRKRTLIVGVVVIVVLLAAAAYVGASMVVYNRLSSVEAHCAGDADTLDNTPASFNTYNNLDTTPYQVTDYEEVSFPSRDDHLSIAAWFIPVSDDASAAPTVILVHGLDSCRRSPAILLAAGMLHRNGFNALLLDLRDHGDSQVEDGRYAGGTEEYRDVLGAWDWLITEKNAAPERIGLLGTSLGAATTLIAAGEEPRVAAVWEDSSYADLHEAIRAELARNGYPEFLVDSAVLMGKLVSGDDLGSLSPLKAVEKMNGRPLFITHGDADTRLSVQYASDLADAIRASGGTVEPWIVAGAEHTRAIFLHPDEYEQHLVEFFAENLGAS